MEKYNDSSKPIVIIISGSGGVGKSTFVSLCKQIDNRIIELSTIDFVKEVALFAGWDGIKDERGRLFLSNLKDCMEKYDDIPNKKIEEQISKDPYKIYFVNAREPKNIKALKEKYNGITLLITNKNIPVVISNHADAGVFDYDYDFIIENYGGLTDFWQQAKVFMDYIKNIKSCKTCEYIDYSIDNIDCPCWNCKNYSEYEENYYD